MTVAMERKDIDTVGRKWKRKARPASNLDVPAALNLEGGEALQPNAAVCMGWYVLDKSRTINNKPVWRHACVAGRWLAHDGSAWLCQIESNLGHPRGSLKLDDGCGGHPGLAPAGTVWKSAASRGWIAQPKLTCRAATLQEMKQGLMTAELAALDAIVRCPPRSALLLEGGELTSGPPNQCLGWYRLQPDRVINLRPVWRHAEKDGIWLAFDQSDWVVSQVLEEQNRSIPLMRISDPLANALPHQLMTRTWAVRDGFNWVAEPTVRCRAAHAVPQALDGRLAQLLSRLATEEGAAPRVTASELHIQLQVEGGVARLETALRESGLISLALLDAADAVAIATGSGLSPAAASDLKIQAFLQLHPGWKAHLHQLADGSSAAVPEGTRGRDPALLAMIELPALRGAQLAPEHVHALRLYGAFACGRRGA